MNYRGLLIVLIDNSDHVSIKPTRFENISQKAISLKKVYENSSSNIEVALMKDEILLMDKRLCSKIIIMGIYDNHYFSDVIRNGERFSCSFLPEGDYLLNIYSDSHKNLDRIYQVTVN